jgi:hypothetical protein
MWEEELGWQSQAIVTTVTLDAEKRMDSAKSSPQALKRGHIFNDLVARVNSCPSRSQSESEFFRNLLGSFYGY